jgi:hypothetical protein
LRWSVDGTTGSASCIQPGPSRRPRPAHVAGRLEDPVLRRLGMPLRPARPCTGNRAGPVTRCSGQAASPRPLEVPQPTASTTAVYGITHALAGSIQLDRSCLLDLLPQLLRPSLVTGLVSARASLTPRLAEASASQSLPSQLNRSGLDAAGRCRDRLSLRGTPSSPPESRRSLAPRARRVRRLAACFAEA